MRLRPLILAMALALPPVPALAFLDPCATPRGYLVICCPKPCQVLDGDWLSKARETLGTAKQTLEETRQVWSEFNGLRDTLGNLGDPSTLPGEPASIEDLLRSMASGGGLLHDLGIAADPRDAAALATAFGERLTRPLPAGNPDPEIADRRRRLSVLYTEGWAAAKAGGQMPRRMAAQIACLAGYLPTARNARDDLALNARIRAAFAQAQAVQANTLSSWTMLRAAMAAAEGVSGAPRPQRAAALDLSPGPGQIAAAAAQKAVASLEQRTDMAALLHDSIVAGREMTASIASLQQTRDAQAATVAGRDARERNLQALFARAYRDPATAWSRARGDLGSIPDRWVDPGKEPTIRRSASRIAGILSADPGRYGRYKEEDVCEGTGQDHTCRKVPVPALVAPEVQSGAIDWLDLQKKAEWFEPFDRSAAESIDLLHRQIGRMSEARGVAVDTPAADAALDRLIIDIENDSAAFKREHPAGGPDGHAGRVLAVDRATAAIRADPGRTTLVARRLRPGS